MKDPPHPTQGARSGSWGVLLLFPSTFCGLDHFDESQTPSNSTVPLNLLSDPG